MIHFEILLKVAVNMELNQIDFKLVQTESPEVLWELFVKTGSVQAYLRYAQSVKIIEELNLSD